jgi:4-hydroxybenzoate polyprenyltransferase/phosphoserine phosphatase
MKHPSSNAALPLCIDCDGTLISTDLLHESVFKLLKSNPLALLLLPAWAMQGKASLKARLAERVSVDPATLPYVDAVVELAQRARAEGRTVVLATASHARPAQAVADHLGIFDEVLATQSHSNLKSDAKGAALVQRYGEQGFDYVGDSNADLPVWRLARRSIVVSTNQRLIKKARAVSEVERVIEPPRPGWRDYLRALRLHQWLKNLLIFVPLFAAHRLQFGAEFSQAVLAFLSFGLCASAVYVLNDLLDLDSDRRHVRKRTRPFAAGLIPIWHGAGMVPLLLASSVALASLLPWTFGAVLGAYFMCTLAYSLLLKRQVIVDVLVLAGLYTLRVIAGGAATLIVPSFWLLAFSMFIFLSLAMVKRYSEMLIVLQQQKEGAAGRGYLVQDLPVLMSVGTSSGLVAVLVFALYINNPETRSIYVQPLWLWLVPPLLLYWVSRVWMKAHRGEVDDDPVVFAIKDWQSLVIVTMAAVFFALA